MARQRDDAGSSSTTGPASEAARDPAASTATPRHQRRSSIEHAVQRDQRRTSMITSNMIAIENSVTQIMPR
jgi:hypothetical protein